MEICGCAGFSKDGGFNDGRCTRRATHLAKEVEVAANRCRAGQSRCAGGRSFWRSRYRRTMPCRLRCSTTGDCRRLSRNWEFPKPTWCNRAACRNPRFDLRHASAAGQYDIEETLSFNVLSLLTMPYAHDIEKRRFAQTQNAVVLNVCALATDTREAFIAAVAARQSVELYAASRCCSRNRRSAGAKHGGGGQLEPRRSSPRTEFLHAMPSQGLAQARLSRRIRKREID